MASVYQGTRSGEMRGTLFTNDQTGTEVDVRAVECTTSSAGSTVFVDIFDRLTRTRSTCLDPPVRCCSLDIF
jgi:hypothetical protein